MRFRSLSSRDFFRQFARNAYLEMLQVLCKEGALTLKPHYTYGAQSSGLMILRSLRVNLSKVGTDRKCFKSPNWQKIELRLGRRKHPWANTCWLFCFSSNRAYTWLSSGFISSVKAVPAATAVGLKDLELFWVKFKPRKRRRRSFILSYAFDQLFHIHWEDLTRSQYARENPWQPFHVLGN